MISKESPDVSLNQVLGIGSFQGGLQVSLSRSKGTEDSWVA